MDVSDPDDLWVNSEWQGVVRRTPGACQMAAQKLIPSLLQIDFFTR
jgi:hypothetical protein